MLLEITPQIGLVGKMQAVGDLLHRQIRRLQEHLDLQQHRAVDELLGRAMRDIAHDGREITCRNAEFVGIERHLALLRTVFVHQRDETVEKLRLARRRFGRLLLHVGVTLQFVVNLQQHVLQAVADDRIAEHIVAVAVGVCGHLKPSTGAFHDAGGRIGDRIFAQDSEKRRFETETGFGEKVAREGAEGHPEILRAVGQHQQRAGQHQNQRVAPHLTAILVHGGVGAALAAVEDRPAFAAARIIAEKGEIGLSDDELFFRCGYYGVSR